MAIQTLRVRVCDHPSQEGEHSGLVCRFRISKLEEDARTVTLDLCESHAEPIASLFELKPHARRTRRAVMPMQEVVAKKKTPTKRSASSKRAAAKR